MSKTSKRRFAYRLDMLFWFIVMLLPLIVYYVMNFRNPETTEFFVFMANFSPFSFIQDVLDSVSETAFGSTFALTSYLGYCVGVEIFHVLFDVIVFIPRLAHKWISKAVQDD